MHVWFSGCRRPWAIAAGQYKLRAEAISPVPTLFEHNVPRSLGVRVTNPCGIGCADDVLFQGRCRGWWP